jgi:membrane associated rhomboid family serine protease
MSLDYQEPAPADEQRRTLTAPIVTVALIAVNVAMFGLEYVWSGGGIAAGRLDEPTAIALFRMGANFGRDAFLAQPWRALASAFLHGGIPHVAMNMWALFVLGSFLERVIGSARVLVVYSAAALAGGITSSFTHGEVLGVGASGAIWGLMVSQMVLLARLRRDAEISWGQLAQPLIINLAISAIPGVDFAAHLGGGIMGGLLTLLIPKRPVGTSDRAWRPWAVLGALLMAASVLAAIVTGQPWNGREPF